MTRRPVRARSDARRAVADRRSARRHRLRRAGELLLRQQARRRVHAAHRGYRSRAQHARVRSARSSRRCAGCGLDWDEGPDVGGPHGPYRQSERTRDLSRICRRAARRAVTRFSCFCTPERLEEMREAQRAAGQPPRYDGLCLHLTPPRSRAPRAAGEPYVVRHEGPARGRRASSTICGAVTIEFECDDRRHAGADEVGRPADLSSRQRRRRPPDGDHARDSRRRVAVVGAQAPAAVPVLRLGAAAADAPAAAAQSRQEQAQQTQESDRHPVLPARWAICPRRCSTFSGC